MTQPFIAQITLFAGNFAPRGWAFCDGQLLAINSNSALFSLVGTIYGGDGRTTFGLPDLRGRAPLGPRNGPGLTSYREGSRGGRELATLLQSQMPSHSHIMGATTAPIPVASTLRANDEEGDQEDAEGNAMAGLANAYSTQAPNTDLAAGSVSASIPAGTAIPAAIGNAGGSQAVDIRQPFLALNYIIALVGIYPSRN